MPITRSQHLRGTARDPQALRGPNGWRTNRHIIDNSDRPISQIRTAVLDYPQTPPTKHIKQNKQRHLHLLTAHAENEVTAKSGACRDELCGVSTMVATVFLGWITATGTTLDQEMERRQSRNHMIFGVRALLSNLDRYWQYVLSDSSIQKAGQIR